jgi:selenocysteine lyase/cysteine desulfurase
MSRTGAVTYLDWAATSAIRPPVVTRAITDYIENVGASPGRGSHRLAIAADRIAFECRQSLARLLGLHGDSGRIAFMFNATHAINTAMNGVLRAGDAVVVSAFDHNAVLRCAHRLARERGVDVRIVAGRRDGSLDDSALKRALDGARLLCINGASNVLGTTLDTTRLCSLARDAGALSLVDTAQIAGELPFDASACGADLVAIAGHKALLGPQGIGALWARAGIDVEPLLVGGSGGDSMLPDMPPAWPDHLQAGTLNAPGIAGLAAAVNWILERTVERIASDAAALKILLHDALSAVHGVRVLSPRAPDGVPIVTIVADDIDPATLAGRLDREFGVLVRPGLHCAPLVHRMIGTETTGAVRLSIGWASTKDEVVRAAECVERILALPASGRGTGTGSGAGAGTGTRVG